MIDLLIGASLETLYMVMVSSFYTLLLGLPLGVTLTLTGKGSILENLFVHQLLSYMINMGRSLPFIILMIFIMPFTRMLVGSSIGTKAAIVPLVVAAIPFFARVVESALQEVDDGVIEAAQSMGATEMQIVLRVLLPEALPSLVLGITITVINLLGYSAMAGAVGGGGIGDLAIRYGYHRFRVDIMLATVLLLIIMVQCIQSTGNLIAHNMMKKRRK